MNFAYPIALHSGNSLSHVKTEDPAILARIASFRVHDYGMPENPARG
jgi:hypothetical protein